VRFETITEEHDSCCRIGSLTGQFAEALVGTMRTLKKRSVKKLFRQGQLAREANSLLIRDSNICGILTKSF